MQALKLILKQFFSLLLSLSLFFGGIILLSLRISGWGLILGLPAVSLGIVFTVLTIDSVSRELFSPPWYERVKCRICGKTTFAKMHEAKICGRCREKEIEGLFGKTS